MLANHRGYASIAPAAPPRRGEEEVSKRGSKRKMFWVLLASLAALSFVGYAAHSQALRPAPERVSKAEQGAQVTLKKHAAGCQKYAGGALVKNTKVFETAFDEQLDVEFQFKINAGSGFGNIVQIGGHGDDEWPAIFFHNQTPDKVTVQFEKQGNSRYWAKDLSPIVEGQTYTLRVEIDGLRCRILLDGVVEHDWFDIPAEFKPAATATLPVHASGNWNTAASGSIEGLVVCTGGASPVTPSPTYNPTTSPTTGSPSPSPTKAPTYDPTASPTPETGAPTPVIPEGDCLLYANAQGEKLERDSSVGTVALTEDFELSFKLTVNALSAEWASILHIGETNIERQPGIWLVKDNKKQLVFAFNDFEGGWTQDLAWIDIELNTEYDIRISVQGFKAAIYFDGVLKQELTLDEYSRFERDEVPLYAGDPWYAPADAVVTDLLYCSEASGEKSLCQEYEGGKIEKNKQVFEVKYTEVLDVQFYVTIDESTGFGNVVQIGGHGDDEWPAVFFNRVTLPNHLDIQFERQGESASSSHSVQIIYGQEHLLRVLIDGLNCKIFLDGDQKYDFDVPAELKPVVKKLPVYASGNWNEPAVGTLGMLRVCNGEDPDPLMPPANECQEFPNAAGNKLEKDDVVFTTPLTEMMDLSFSLTVNALNDDWTSVVHVGETNQERQPGIWLRNGRKSDLTFTFNAQGSWTGQDVVYLPIELNKEYEVRVTMYKDRAKIFFDGELKEDVQLESGDRVYKETSLVYAADPWYRPADAVVKNLRICSEEVNQLHSAPRPVACNLHANGQGDALQHHTQVFTTPVTTNFDLSFKLKVNAVSAEWASIVHIGETNRERQPGIWLVKDNRKEIVFAFNHGEWAGQNTAYVDIEIGVEYDVRVTVRDLDVHIFMGGELAKFLRIQDNDRSLREGVPVYAADPWYVAADAVVKDLKVCYGDGSEASLCQQYAGGEIMKNTQVFNAPYTHVMDVQFYAIIDEGSSFGNVIQIGGHGDDEWPAVFFNKVVESNFLDIQFERQGNKAYFGRKVEITPGHQHLLRVLIEGLDCKIFLDGEEKVDFDIPSQMKPTVKTLPVYASGDWNSAADGSLGTMRVCNGEDPSPLEPESGMCQYEANAGGAKLVRDTQVFSTATTSKMEISFKFTLFAYSAEWASVLHVGNANNERQPGIWVVKDNRKQIVFAFNGANVGWSGQDTQYVDVDLNEEHKVRILLDDTLAKIYMDGEVYSVPLQSSDRFYRNSVPVYMADPWYVAADAVVKDLKVCYFG